MDNDWAYADDFLNDDYNSDGLTNSSPQTKLLQASLIEELTGALADDLNLQNIQGSVFFSGVRNNQLSEGITHLRKV